MKYNKFVVDLLIKIEALWAKNADPHCDVALELLATVVHTGLRLEAMYLNEGAFVLVRAYTIFTS